MAAAAIALLGPAAAATAPVAQSQRGSAAAFIVWARPIALQGRLTARDYVPVAAEWRSDVPPLFSKAGRRRRGQVASVVKSAKEEGEAATAEGNNNEEGGGGGDGDEEREDFDIRRLEAYTQRVRSEVLCVNALLPDDEEEGADDEEGGGEDEGQGAEQEQEQVIVFKGFSSSLTRATPDDASEPLLPPTAVIVGIDRIRGPFQPSNPKFIQRGMSWPDFRRLLQAKGL